MKNNYVEDTNDLRTNLSNDQRIVLDSVDIPSQVNIKIESSPSISNDAIQMNESFELVRIMYQDILSPQLEKNEILKRKQKQTLMINIFKILKIQFAFTYIFVFMLVIGVLGSSILHIPESIIDSVIKFVEFYITSIVVELISILFFIVKNVFDRSIVDLIKNFDKRNKKKKRQKH